MASHRLWAAYKALTPTQMIVLACGGGTAAGAVVYALTAATDPEQRLARARKEMMRIPRLRRADEDALAEARARTRRVQQMVEASKTASTTERLETVARATEAFYRGDDDRPK
jgi:predicted acylesterase/phospholipase RssA